MAYLSGADAKPAPRADAATARRDGDGSLTAPFTAGSVLLVPEKHGSAPGPVRLVFAKKGEAVPVPAGRYTVRNYSIETRHKDEFWALSASGPDGRAVEVKAGAAAALEIDPRVQLTVRAMPHGKAIHVGLMVQGDSKMGLSVIRGDDRVKPSYKLAGSDGSTVAEGPLTYG